MPSVGISWVWSTYGIRRKQCGKEYMLYTVVAKGRALALWPLLPGYIGRFFFIFLMWEMENIGLLGEDEALFHFLSFVASSLCTVSLIKHQAGKLWIIWGFHSISVSIPQMKNLSASIMLGTYFMNLLVVVC